MERRSQSTIRRCNLPASEGCECASMKPGSTVFPARSILRVPDVARFSTSLLLPTAKTLPRAIATACARGSAAFTVQMFPLWRINSGFSCSNGNIVKAAIDPRNSRRVGPLVICIFLREFIAVNPPRLCLTLPWWPTELAAAKQVQMQMKDRLTGASAIVEDRAVTIEQVALAG